MCTCPACGGSVCPHCGQAYPPITKRTFPPGIKWIQGPPVTIPQPTIPPTYVGDLPYPNPSFTVTC